MSLIINITERDIFNYIFFNDKLSVEVSEYLLKNEDKFEHINFYKTLKKNLKAGVDDGIKEKLADRISAYKKSPQIYKLFPVDINIEKTPKDMPVLAAASKTEKQKVIAKTFLDDSKNFIVRMLTYNKKTTIFPFTLKSEDTVKLKLTFYPSNNSYITDSDKFLELENEEEIESINVETLT